MTTFRFFALASSMATYFLIFIGGLVRVAGAGMGCPDWPKCFGRWIPPINITQIPPEIDPSTFNLTLAWIEYGNRVVGVTIGLLIAVTAILALKHFARTPRVVIPTVAAALLTAFQGWQGSVLVATELQPIIVSVHMVLALIIVSLLLFATQQSRRYERNASLGKPSGYSSRVHVWAGLLWLGAVAQIILGTQVRQALEELTKQFPLWSGMHLFGQISIIDDLHLLLGVAMVAITIVVGYSVLKQSERPSPMARQLVWGMVVFIVAQVGLGITVMFVGLEPLLQLFHLWVASLYVGFALLLYTITSPTEVTATAPTPGFARLLVFGSVIVLVLGSLAFGVVRQAERSREDIPIITRLPGLALESTSGQEFSLENLRGKVTVFAFMFTRCHTICPTMAIELREMYDLYAHSDLVQLVSIDVDPEYDSLDVLRAYLSDHGVTDHRWQFIRTDLAIVSELAERGFLVSGDFPGMHSSKFILVDQGGFIRGYYEHADASAMERLQADIRTLAFQELL